MAYKIGENCIACGCCISECPNGAIRDGERIAQINPDRCTECVGAHGHPECEVTCAVMAPLPDPAHVETRAELLDKFKKLHPKRTPMYV
jgi:ferredoxin